MALQSKTITGSTNNSNWTWKMEVIENGTNTSANTSSVTVNSYLGRASSASYFGGNASVNITCNGTSRSASKTFTYPTNVSGGGWVLVQSETFTITHNSDGSKDISISSSMSTGDFTPSSASASGSMTLTKIPRYANITSFVVNKRDETSVTFSWGADATCDYVWYSKDNGSNWSALSSNNIVTGLSANTSYNFKLRVRRKDSQLTTDSGTYNQTTYNYPYCTEAPNFTIGNKVTIKFYNPLNRQIKIQMWSHRSSAFVSDLITTSGTSYTGFDNVSSRLYASIPNNSDSRYNIDVHYSSNKAVKEGGTYSINSNNCIPVVGNITYRDSKESTIAITEDNQRIIRNHSNLLFTIGSATAKNSATISKYEVTIGGVTKSRTSVGDLDFGTLNLASSSNATLKVTDSRGISNTKQINVTIDNWELPTALIDLKRKNNFYSETYLKVDGTCSYLNGKNEINIKYQYKKANDTNYSNLIDIEDNKQETIDLDNNYQWNVKAIITDKLGTTTYNVILERGMPITYFDRMKNSVGINCFPKYDENVELNGESIKGSIVASSTEPTKGEEVWIQKGKNLWGNINTSIVFNGLTTKINNSKFTMTGTAEWQAWCFETRGRPSTYLKAGTYTLSIKNFSGSFSNPISLNVTHSSGTILDVVVNSTSINNYWKSFTLTQDSPIYLDFYINSNNTVFNNVNFNIQIEQGSSPTDFEEFIPKKIYTKNNNGIYEEFCDAINFEIVKEW